MAMLNNQIVVISGLRCGADRALRGGCLRAAGGPWPSGAGVGKTQ